MSVLVSRVGVFLVGIFVWGYYLSGGSSLVRNRHCRGEAQRVI